MSRTTVSKSGQAIAARAVAAGWVAGNGFLGPRDFLKLTPAERREFKRVFKTGRLSR